MSQALSRAVSADAPPACPTDRLPADDDQFNRVRYYIEDEPVPEYHNAPPAALERFRDLKYGIRIVWGVYSLLGIEASWPILTHFNDRQRADYYRLHERFNPVDFDAEKWAEMFQRVGLKMFALTCKHQDGFSLFHTETRVRSRVNWAAPGGPKFEACDFAYGIQDTPFKRDIVKELCDAARKRGIAVDLYFTHPDHYDTDFRGFGLHPVQTPEYRQHPERFGNGTGSVDDAVMMGPDVTQAELDRMMQRYGDQLRELLSNYGKVDLLCFDQWLGPKVWPPLRQLLIELKTLQPECMFRARGIGNYGDYYTPEQITRDGREPTTMPWFSIHCLAKLFAYDPVAANYKDGRWIIHTLVDAVAKGGGFMVTLGPDGWGNFHPRAVEALEDAGRWLAVNGEAIYGTRPRDPWREGDVLFTRSKDGHTVYAIFRERPPRVLRLASVTPRGGANIRLLGDSRVLKWRQDDGLVIELPEFLPAQCAWVVRIPV